MSEWLINVRVTEPAAVIPLAEYDALKGCPAEAWLRARLLEAMALLDEASTVVASDDWFARYELFKLSEGVTDVPRPIETPWSRAK